MSVARSMFWSYSGNLVMLASSLASGMIVARILTPAQIGAFAVGVATLVVIQSMLQMGLASFLVREKEVDAELIGSAVAIAALQGALISGLLLLLAPAVGAFQRAADVTTVILLIAPVPLLASIEAVGVGLWIRAMNFKSLALLMGLKALTQAGVSVGLALAGYGPAGLAAGYLISAIFGLAVIARSLARYPLNLSHWRTLTKFGTSWMVLGGIKSVNARIPEFLLGRTIGLAAAGYYNRAGASVDMVAKAGMDPIAQVLVPLLAREHRETGVLNAGIIRLSSTLTGVFWPILAALALLSEPVIRVMYGDQWGPSAPVLALLSLWLAVTLLAAGGLETLLFLDRLKLSAQIEGARVVGAVLILIAAAPYGLIAVAAARIVETAIGVVPYLLAMRRLADLSLRQWAAAQSRSALAAALTVGPLWLFRTQVAQPASPFFQLVLALPIVVVAQLAGLFIVRHPLARELVQAAGRFWRTHKTPRVMRGSD